MDESFCVVTTDNQTNFLYLADTLPFKHQCFYQQLQSVLQAQGITHSLLPGTKDIWAVDYMPVQTGEDTFIKFVYEPDYLKDTIKWRKTISDTTSICTALGLPTTNSNIVLDGGNVVKGKDKAILCDKVFKENPHYNERELIKELERSLEVDKLIFFPTDPKDKIGHADGMVRFLGDNTVLVNAYRAHEKELGLRCKLALQNAGLDWIEVPYNPYGNKGYLQANGIYINYLQMRQSIILPVFGMEEDDIAFRQFESVFAGQNIVTIESNDIANDGGVLNCISWNIMANSPQIPN